MADYLKDNTNYGIYLFDTVKDTWIADHSGAPGEIDISLYTLGEDYIYLDDVKSIQGPGKSLQNSWHVGNGVKNVFTYGDSDIFWTITGDLDEATAEKWENFRESQNRSAANQMYLIYRRSSTDYKLWPTTTATIASMVKYVPVIVKAIIPTWSEGMTEWQITLILEVIY